MSLILRQVIGYEQGKKSVSTTADPALKNQLTQAQKNLNSILKKWKWDGAYPTTSQEFINKFSPWVDSRIKENKDLNQFLTDNHAENLAQINQQLISYEERIEGLKTEVERLKSNRESSEELEALETERDQAIREQKTLEQELLALNNKFRLKQQEVNNKEAEITRIKTEHSEKIKAADKKTQEWKDKYSKKAQQLDQEQVAGAKLEEKITNLESKITQLEQQNRKLIAELAEKE